MAACKAQSKLNSYSVPIVIVFCLNTPKPEPNLSFDMDLEPIQTSLAYAYPVFLTGCSCKTYFRELSQVLAHFVNSLVNQHCETWSTHKTLLHEHIYIDHIFTYLPKSQNTNHLYPVNFPNHCDFCHSCLLSSLSSHLSSTHQLFFRRSK